MHGGNLPEFAKQWPRRVRACLRRATVVTAPSEYLVNEMHEYREDVHLVPNPLDINLYPFNARSHPAPRLVWLRRFRYVYNPELAPRLVSLLSREFPAIRLTMIGPDWGDGSFQRTQDVAHDCGVRERIDFAGGVARSEVPAWLGQSDIFLNTTDFDNSPVSILEAMACGLCIVSTDVGGIRYLLEHETNALLVPPNNPAAMAEAIKRILTEPQLGQRLSRNARRKAEEFDWSAILPRWKELLAKAQLRMPH
jgi:glycosyltransferase involved in cell wall biosynthesis